MACNEQKVAYIIRYLIFCAEKKDFLQYDDIRKIFGVSGESLGEYADKVGEYCYRHGLPLLNALIVNSSGSVGDGWKDWVKFMKINTTWEEAVNNCFKTYHISLKTNRFKPYNDVSIPQQKGGISRLSFARTNLITDNYFRPVATAGFADAVSHINLFDGEVFEQLSDLRRIV